MEKEGSNQLNQKNLYEFRGYLSPEEYRSVQKALADLSLRDFVFTQQIVEQSYDDLLSAREVEDRFNTEHLQKFILIGKETYLVTHSSIRSYFSNLPKAYKNEQMRE